MAPPFSPWPKASCFQFEAKYFKGLAFRGSSILRISWQLGDKITPWLVVQGQPCSLRRVIPLEAASAHPYRSFSTRWPLSPALDAHVSNSLPSSYPSFHPASLQGRGCCMSGYSLAPHSLHSQSMSVPSPGALALLVEAVVFPPIPSHSRLFCC